MLKYTVCSAPLALHSQMLTVLIGGGHAAGKKTTAEMIKSKLSHLNLDIELVDMNDFQEKQDDLPQEPALAITVSPDRLVVVLKPLRFDFAKLAQYLGSAEKDKIFIVHGLYALYDKDLRDLSQLKVFIAGDADTRLIRWIRRDVLGTESPAKLDTIIAKYLHGAKQEMSDYIFPTKERADVILPRGAEENAVNLIVDGLLPYLGSPSGSSLRPTETPLLGDKFDSQKSKYYELT